MRPDKTSRWSDSCKRSGSKMVLIFSMKETREAQSQNQNMLQLYLTVLVGGQSLQNIRNGQVCIDPGSVQLQQPVWAQGLLEGLCRDPCRVDAGAPQTQVLTVLKHAHRVVIQQTWRGSAAHRNRIHHSDTFHQVGQMEQPKTFLLFPKTCLFISRSNRCVTSMRGQKMCSSPIFTHCNIHMYTSERQPPAALF